MIKLDNDEVSRSMRGIRTFFALQCVIIIA